ncbi:hypothetical protein PPL_00774 [Heterostelium album PN500]|uniref:Uncharacterized protein n=1 Tax=Heterostelium pallidum (strain ATCC 26659 / Pp 5 / PN500) TaxID=670386 RepID=D3AXE3_HETP5|nr:hypothetical protein PPL_00774 [Heterostelium album PN500]EFA86212.1 hypothetical protein PPL_00774 [Heterostelium album PN500]|eukprot:XP_020438317.1 hypothetical protein PPL_00774 [Heterostelium album PN500]
MTFLPRFLKFFKKVVCVTEKDYDIREVSPTYLYPYYRQLGHLLKHHRNGVQSSTLTFQNDDAALSNVNYEDGLRGGATDGRWKRRYGCLQRGHCSSPVSTGSCLSEAIF